MEMQEAIQVLRALAGGLDPENSQPLDAGSILLRPQVVRTLNRALSAMVQEEARAKNKPANSGRYWSREEDAKVCEEARQGINLDDMAKAHNRSVGSILARLVKLGKMAPKTPGEAA